MFRVFGGDVLGESGEEAITVFGDRAEQTRPLALPREFDRGTRALRKPRGTRLNLDGFLGLIDTDYCGVHLPALFLSASSNCSRSSGSAFAFSGRGCW